MRVRTLLFCAIFIQLPNEALAGLDLLGIGEASENVKSGLNNHADSIRSAIASLEAMQVDVDEDVREYIERVSGIVEQAEASTQRSIIAAQTALRDLEAQIYRDISDIVEKIECAAIRTQDEAINQSLRGLLPSALRGDSRFVSLPYDRSESGNFLFGSRSLPYMEIDLSVGPTPDSVFLQIEKAYLDNISTVGEDENAYGIISAYSNLARLSRLTSCHFSGDARIPWIKKFAEYNSLVGPWVKTLEVRELLE